MQIHADPETFSFAGNQITRAVCRGGGIHHKICGDDRPIPQGIKFTEVLSFRGLESGLLSLRVSCYRVGLGIPSATPKLLSPRGGFTVGHTQFAIPQDQKSFFPTIIPVYFIWESPPRDHRYTRQFLHCPNKVYRRPFISKMLQLPDSKGKRCCFCCCAWMDGGQG